MTHERSILYRVGRTNDEVFYPIVVTVEDCKARQHIQHIRWFRIPQGGLEVRYEGLEYIRKCMRGKDEH